METLYNTCKELTRPFWELWLTKGLVSVGAVGVAVLLGEDLHRAAGAVTILIVIDTLTAVWAEKKTGEDITYRRFATVMPKILRYGLFLVAAHQVQSLIGFDVYVEDVVVVFLATTEFISIAENLAKLGMPVPAKLLNKIHEIRDSK